jgi:hypothetical protein
MLAAVGSALLGASLFLPWYTLHWASNGVAPAYSRVDNGVAYSYLQLTLALLSIAWCGVVLSLLRFASIRIPLRRSRDPIVVLGVLAVACVAFLMAHGPRQNPPAFSLRAGTWLALFGSLAIAVGGAWRPPQHAQRTGELSASMRVAAARNFAAALAALTSALAIDILLWWSGWTALVLWLLGMTAALIVTGLDLYAARRNRRRPRFVRTSTFVLCLWPILGVIGVGLRAAAAVSD